MPTMENRTGWLPTPGPEQSRLDAFFVPFRGQGLSETDWERSVAWDSVDPIIGKEFWTQYQLWQDCVAFGAKKVFEAIMADEIVRLGQSEKWRPIFAPWVYAVCRCAPEGGGGRLRGDGAFGGWVAATIGYGLLALDEPNVPKYSASVSKSWGNCNGWKAFAEIAKPHFMKSAAKINSAQELADACTNKYWCTIAGNREFTSSLVKRGGKGWYGRGRRYAHQTAILGFDINPEPCFYDSNQWPDFATDQTDGPVGGGWRTFDYVDKELRSGDVECYAFSGFEGFPAIPFKPNLSLGA